jgi:hypothetical protein
MTTGALCETEGMRVLRVCMHAQTTPQCTGPVGVVCVKGVGGSLSIILSSCTRGEHHPCLCDNWVKSARCLGVLYATSGALLSET